MGCLKKNFYPTIADEEDEGVTSLDRKSQIVTECLTIILLLAIVYKHGHAYFLSKFDAESISPFFFGLLAFTIGSPTS